jgi:hypothetical protein
MEELKQFLTSLQPGEIIDKARLTHLLSRRWEEFAGSDQGGMAGYKLNDRIERPTWDPPRLSFEIVRHRKIARGSTRGTVQDWVVDVEELTARCTGEKDIQIRKPAPRTDVGPIADELVRAIEGHAEDPRLEWKNERRVRVNVSRALPAEGRPRWTIEGLHGRLQQVLNAQLEPLGWTHENRNMYINR